MKNLLLIIILSLFIFNSIIAQDTVRLLNGKIHELSSYELDNDKRKLFYFNKRGKTKFFHFDHIFSITDTLGNEEVYFTPRKIDTTYYSVENMRSYITGFDIAENEYTTNLATGSGFVVGGSSVYVFQIPIYAALPIAAYTTIFGMTKPSKKIIQKRYPDHSEDEFFIEGYRESATGKRTWNTVKGILGGIVVGISTSIIKNN